MSKSSLAPRQASLEFNERICAHAACGRKFIIPYTVSAYAYRIPKADNTVDYFCRYSHFKAEKETREQATKDRALARKKTVTKEPYKYQKYTD